VCVGLISATESNTVRKNLTGVTRSTENAKVQGTCMKTLHYCKTGKEKFNIRLHMGGTVGSNSLKTGLLIILDVPWEQMY
jgi:hypothetical protein